MAGPLPEADWKLFRRLRRTAPDRFGQQVLEDVGRLAAEPGRGPHDRYLGMYRLVRPGTGLGRGLRRSDPVGGTGAARPAAGPGGC